MDEEFQFQELLDRLLRGRNLDRLPAEVADRSDADRVLAVAVAQTSGDRQLDILRALSATDGDDGDAAVARLVDPLARERPSLKQSAVIVWGKRKRGAGTELLAAAAASAVTRPEALWYLGAVGEPGFVPTVTQAWVDAVRARTRSKRPPTPIANPVGNAEFGGIVYALRCTDDHHALKDVVDRESKRLYPAELEALWSVYADFRRTGLASAERVTELSSRLRQLLNL